MNPHHDRESSNRWISYWNIDIHYQTIFTHFIWIILIRVQRIQRWFISIYRSTPSLSWGQIVKC